MADWWLWFWSLICSTFVKLNVCCLYKFTGNQSGGCPLAICSSKYFLWSSPRAWVRLAPKKTRHSKTRSKLRAPNHHLAWDQLQPLKIWIHTDNSNFLSWWWKGIQLYPNHNLAFVINNWLNWNDWTINCNQQLEDKIATSIDSYSLKFIPVFFFFKMKISTACPPQKKVGKLQKKKCQPLASSCLLFKMIWWLRRKESVILCCSLRVNLKVQITKNYLNFNQSQLCPSIFVWMNGCSSSSASGSVIFKFGVFLSKAKDQSKVFQNSKIWKFY